MNASQKELNQLLSQNQAPLPDQQTRQLHIQNCKKAILSMDYLGQQSFLEKILTQASYLSPLVWITQAGILIILLLFALQESQTSIFSCLLLLPSILTLILLYELSKSFSCHMWELESGCRYNLPQLFLMRLCILGFCDLLILGSSLIAFRIVGGSLWLFCLCTLLPFFVSAALCLWALRILGNRCTPLRLSVIPILTAFLCTFWENQVYVWLSNGFPLEKVSTWATLSALLFFLYHAVRLCAKQNDFFNRKEKTVWN